MAYAHVGHDSIIGDHVIMVNNSSLAGQVIVGDWAILSGYALVHHMFRLARIALLVLPPLVIMMFQRL